MVATSSLWKLRLTMAGTVAVIIGVSTLAFTGILWWMESFDIVTMIGLVLVFNLAQWLLAPYLVNAIYGVKRMEANERPELHSMVEGLSQRSGIKAPQLMISSLPIPNAFAYGSPLAGTRVAVTQGLLDELQPDEVEAVIGHEIGHLKHRDMQAMMLVSFMPSLFYILARSMLFSSYYGGRDRRDSGGLAVIGGASMLVYLVLTMFNLSLSRLREYYADQHSASVVEDGGRKLSEALAKISTSTLRTQMDSGRKPSSGSFKALFISDPDHAAQDVAELRGLGSGSSGLVDEILSRRISPIESLTELFSTHPNIVKRLRALQS
jgi:heat shock protein HtpX